MRLEHSLDSYLNMPVCDRNQDGWCAATDLLISDNARLKELVMSYGQASWGTNNHHVAASAFIVAYLTRVIYPVIGQYVLRRRVPKTTLENLAFHHQGERIDATGLRQPEFAVLPNDPTADHPDAEVLNNEQDPYVRLRE
jgi:hypothetical protein